MSVKPKRNQKNKGRTSKQFMNDPFELGRSGDEWFSSSRPKGESWCGGMKKTGKKGGKKAEEEDY